MRERGGERRGEESRGGRREMIERGRERERGREKRLR